MTLHPKLGVNPRMVRVHCFACGQTKDDALVLLGNRNSKVTCPNCKATIIGGVHYNEKCPKCGHVCDRNNTWPVSEPLSDSEHVEQTGICSECEGHMKNGIILISVRDGESGDNPYRTGGWCVIKEEAVRRMVTPKELADDICRKRMCFIPDEVWERIGLPRGVNN